jgi:hypothetical protein
MTPGTTLGGAVEQLEALARKPLQPRRALLRQLARRFRAIRAAERAQDRRAA